MVWSSAEALTVTPDYTQPSLNRAFQECGYYTCFLSNQSTERTFIDYYKSEADTLIQLIKNEDRYPYDEEMLPHLERIIHQTDQNLLIVMHTYGSHFEYSERYPRSFAAFKSDISPRLSSKYRESVVNSYDNLILYHDYV